MLYICVYLSGQKRKLKSKRDVWALTWIVAKKQRTTAPQLTEELNVRLNSPVSTVNAKDHRIILGDHVHPKVQTLYPEESAVY